ncbi:MAG: Mov34/MPN/PAD-1 family protein [Planctomycetota bacterium]
MANTSDYRGIGKGEAKEAKFPVEIAGEYRVHISEEAYSRMRKHAETTNEVELAGVLIGTVHRDGAGFFLMINGVIEGQNANNYGAQVTFTHQTWEHINKTKDAQYPKERIVGWYHTHPGFGVFLSGMDSFIQENYFNHPYQVAIVIETKQNKEGCFAWVEGKSVPLRRYWVGNREVALAAGEAEPFDPAHAASGAPPLTRHSPQGGEGGVGGQPQRSMLPSFYSLLLMAILFLCGLMLGKLLAVGELREGALAGLESEIYSVLEFAAVNTAASKDLADVNEKLAALSQKLEKGDTAGASQGLHELAGQVDTLQKAYDKRRSAFRNDMNQLMRTKQGLGERVEATARRQDELGAYLAQLYVMRMMDLLRKDGVPLEPSQLGPAERQQVKAYLATAISLCPEIKAYIERVQPKLLEALFPEAGAASEAPKENKEAQGVEKPK